MTVSVLLWLVFKLFELKKKANTLEEQLLFKLTKET